MAPKSTTSYFINENSAFLKMTASNNFVTPGGPQLAHNFTINLHFNDGSSIVEFFFFDISIGHQVEISTSVEFKIYLFLALKMKAILVLHITNDTFNY